MRLWHMLLGVLVSGLIFGFVRLAGTAAIASAIGVALVAISIGILVFSEDAFRWLGRLWIASHARRGPTRLPSILGSQLLIAGYVALILASVLVLCGILAFLILAITLGF